MFEVGSIWIVGTWEGSDDGGMTTYHHNCEVLEYTGTLLHYRQAAHEHVINTASPHFAGAQPQPPAPTKITLDFGFTLPGAGT